MRAKQLDDALAHATRAAQLGRDLPDADLRVATAQRLAGDIELARNKYDAAARWFARAAVSAGGRHALRRKMLLARLAALKKTKQTTKRAAVKHVERIIGTDAKLQARLRRPALTKQPLAALLRDVVEASALYERDRDRDRAAWARAVGAMALVRSKRAPEGLERAEAILKPRSPPARYVIEVALEAARHASRATSDIDAEAEYALRLNAIHWRQLDPADRRYRRTRTTHSACFRYERDRGEGACAALAFQVTGEHNFWDPSFLRRQGLSTDDVARSQTQFIPVLNTCLSEAAKLPDNEDLFDDAEMAIAWSIGSDGKTFNVEIAPSRYDPVIGDCVRERVAWFRYPRSTDGQIKSVRVPYRFDRPQIGAGRRAEEPGPR